MSSSDASCGRNSIENKRIKIKEKSGSDSITSANEVEFSASPLLNLPEDLIIREVIPLLDVRSVLKFAATCKRFQYLCDADKVWMDLVNFR
jgi:hypothetical protein